MTDTEVTNNLETQQFELRADGKLAFLQYQRLGDQIVLIHTEVPPEMEGKGVGGRLAKAGLEYARQHLLKVVPLCEFVRSYLTRHPEYQELVKQSPGMDL